MVWVTDQLQVGREGEVDGRVRQMVFFQRECYESGVKDMFQVFDHLVICQCLRRVNRLLARLSEGLGMVNKAGAAISKEIIMIFQRVKKIVD